MRFQLTEDQKALRAGMRELLARRFDGAALRSAAEEPRLDRALWRELGAAGFFALRVPEADGGVGLGLPEAVLVFEEAGRALLPGPLVATHLAAGTVPGAATGEAVVTDVDSGGLVEWLSEADVVRGDATAAVSLRSVDPLTPLHRIPGAGGGPGRAGREGSSVPLPGPGAGQESSVRLLATGPSPTPGSSSAAAHGSSSRATSGSSSAAVSGPSSVEGAGSSSAVAGGSSSAAASGSAFVDAPGSRSTAVPGLSSVEAAGSSSVAAPGGAPGRSSEAGPGWSSSTTSAPDPSPSNLPVSRSPRVADPVAVLLTAAEQLGTATRVCELAVQHAGTREQFGQPIGAFQAVKHLCAQMLVRAETARAAVYAAAVTADPVDVAAARLLADEAAERGARDCLQVHGGMGFTWECEVQLHLKRAWVRARRTGGGAESEELLAVDLLA
ncbi:acyl-CoA dehydrogenase family protein [Streptomyces canus]|uniref:acyl-CoA dehydrogenase family protein n=1 Tax=Streptomyces canus TaxID=58343 RepID=UPI003AF370FA